MTPEAVSLPASGHARAISLVRIDEPRGSLCVVESGRDVPFLTQRAYWIFDVPIGGQRADHAHREQSELLVAINGGFTVRCDDGTSRTSYRLESPDEGLLIPPMVFHRLESFAPKSSCLVLASGPYDPDEYVCEYGQFLELIAQR